MKLILGALLASLGALLAPPVLAQDEGQPGFELLRERSGPYEIVASGWPEHVIVGNLRVGVQLTNTASGEAVTDATVRVYAYPPDGGERQVSPALNAPHDPTTYIASLELLEEGDWTIQVDVQGAQGPASAGTPLHVNQRARGGDTLVWGSALFGLVALVFAGGTAWLVFSSRKARRQRANSRRAVV
jgi:hypothetical protein